MFSRFFLWVAVALALVLCASGKRKHHSDEDDDNDDDVSDRIFGLFDLKTSMDEDDMQEVMKEMEFHDKDRQVAKSAKWVTVEITKERKKYHYIVRTPTRTFESRFENGKMFVDKLFDGRKHNATITLKASTGTRDEIHEKFTCHHVAEFYDDGFDVTYSVTKNNKTTTAKQRFTRRREAAGFHGFLGLFGGR